LKAVQCRIISTYASVFRRSLVFRIQVGFIKGKSAIRMHWQILGTKRMTGLSFWATEYCISTVGLDEEMIRIYIHDKNDSDS